MDSMQDLKNYDYHSFLPYNGGPYRNMDEVRIGIQNSEISTVPGDSFLKIEGTIDFKKKAGVAATAAGSTIKLSNNSFAFLFDSISYELNGKEAIKSRSLGVASTARALLTQTPSELVGLQIGGWGTPIIDDKHHFFGFIPLSHLLSKFNDFKSAVIRMRQELVLVRARTDKNAFKYETNPDNEDVAFSITNLQWVIPIVKFNLGPEKLILDKVKNNAMFDMHFRSFDVFEYPQLPSSTHEETWKLMTTSSDRAPAYVILLFQTERNDNDRVDSSKFDNVNLRSIRVKLNDVTLPQQALDESFESGNFLRFYHNYLNFISDYSNGEKLCEPALDMAKFKDNNPIFVVRYASMRK